jgi:hypothetical protein
MLTIFTANRNNYSEHGDASPLLGLASSKMYTFIRQKLNIPFLRKDDMKTPEDFPGHDLRTELDKDSSFPGIYENGKTRNTDGNIPTTGELITTIYNALRSGVLYRPAMESLQEAHEL